MTMKGWDSRSSAEGRSAGSYLRHMEMNERIDGENGGLGNEGTVSSVAIRWSTSQKHGRRRVGLRFTSQ